MTNHLKLCQPKALEEPTMSPAQLQTRPNPSARGLSRPHPYPAEARLPEAGGIQVGAQLQAELFRPGFHLANRKTSGERHTLLTWNLDRGASPVRLFSTRWVRLTLIGRVI